MDKFKKFDVHHQFLCTVGVDADITSPMDFKFFCNLLSQFFINLTFMLTFTNHLGPPNA